MRKLHSLALGSAVALGLIGAAHAADSAVTGTWKLTVGSAEASCTLNFADDGNVTNNGDCGNGGDTVGHWKAVGTRLQLLSNNNTLVAYLSPKGDAYQGKRVADGRVVALAR
jgi:hypothetical protein